MKVKRAEWKHQVRILNTNVKSVLPYGRETWRMTTGLQHKIQVLINKVKDKSGGLEKIQINNFLIVPTKVQQKHTLRKEHGNGLATYGENL